MKHKETCRKCATHSQEGPEWRTGQQRVGSHCKRPSSSGRSTLSESDCRENELGERIHPECGQRYSMSWSPSTELKKKMEKATPRARGQHSSLSAPWSTKKWAGVSATYSSSNGRYHTIRAVADCTLTPATINLSSYVGLCRSTEKLFIRAECCLVQLQKSWKRVHGKS